MASSRQAKAGSHFPDSHIIFFGAARWKSFATIKTRCRSADALPGNRVVFNLKGNAYRLVVHIHYHTRIVFIRFVGTHADYDRIDATTI